MRAPKAVLLDFGGVIVETTRRPAWAAELAADVHARLVHAGCAELTAEEIETDIRAGARADKYWKDSTSRLPAPVEMTHRAFWADYVAGDWPAQARALVAAEASALVALMGRLRSDRKNRPFMTELLTACAERGVPAGVVSNALCGAVHRDHMAETGLERLVAVQVYSDEVGVRKPNPEMIHLACRALGVDPADAWYVGDNYDRDVLCAARAGVGASILMRSHGTDDIPFVVRQSPSATVEDPRGLLDLLERTWI